MFNRPAFLGQVRLAQANSQPAQSAGTKWWLHHIMNTRAYGEAAVAKDTPASLAALKELWDAVKDWERITGSWTAGLLMAEHTALAKLLVDCFVQGEGEPCTTSATNALLRNVEAQRALFPRQAAQFGDLFERHTKLAGTYITDFAEGRMDDFNAHFAEALQNGEELGAFTDRVFFQTSG